MRTTTAFILFAALISLTSAFTFLLPLEVDPKTMEKYVLYKENKYPLSDEKQVAVFVDGECVIELDIRKTEKSATRGGNGICKNIAMGITDNDWVEYVKSRLEDD